MTDTPRVAPPGWYPDPSGAAQWRVWNGSTWTEVVRPFDESRPESVVHDLASLRSQHRLRGYGVLAQFLGLGLLSASLNAVLVPRWFFAMAFGSGVGLTVIGSASFAIAARHLRGYWYFSDVVPALNVLSWTMLALRHDRSLFTLTGQRMWRVIIFCSVVLWASPFEGAPLAALASIQWYLVDQLVARHHMA